jgi:hypothetical protein
MEIKKIETYSLYEFCEKVQQSIIEGWRFDFESNELFPTAFGSMLVTGMVKTGDKLPEQAKVQTEDKAKVEVETEVEKLVDEFADKLQDIIEDKAEVKRGRKPKDNT